MIAAATSSKSSKYEAMPSTPSQLAELLGASAYIIPSLAKNVNAGGLPHRRLRGLCVLGRLDLRGGLLLRGGVDGGGLGYAVHRRRHGLHRGIEHLIHGLSVGAQEHYHQDKSHAARNSRRAG